MNKLRGGKGDKFSKGDMDPKEYAMGVKVEREHTSDPEEAGEIALDHGAEDKHYYSKLKSCGLADELKEMIKEAFLKEIGDTATKQSIHFLFQDVAKELGETVAQKYAKRTKNLPELEELLTGWFLHYLHECAKYIQKNVDEHL